jgi:hypothetical protein
MDLDLMRPEQWHEWVNGVMMKRSSTEYPFTDFCRAKGVDPELILDLYVQLQNLTTIRKEDGDLSKLQPEVRAVHEALRAFLTLHDSYFSVPHLPEERNVVFLLHCPRYCAALLCRSLINYSKLAHGVQYYAPFLVHQLKKFIPFKWHRRNGFIPYW